MIKALAAEFYKVRRRKVWLIVMALVGVQIMWMIWSCRYINAQELKQGWMHFLYQFPMLNAIMMPVTAAVVASKLSDTEHKGNTLKLLKTIMPAGRLFDAKFLCGSFYMVIIVVFQVLAMIAVGHVKCFYGAVPASMFGYYFLFTAAVNLTILLLQQVLSLMFVNQMVPLSIGLIGGLGGLYTMFFSRSVQKFILWAYYCVFALAGMDWNASTRVCRYYWMSVNWYGLIVLAVVFFVIYIVGRSMFIRKEI